MIVIENSIPLPFPKNWFNMVLLFFPLLTRQLVTALIQYGGRNVRGSDLFGQNKTPLSLTRRFFKGLKASKRRKVWIGVLLREISPKGISSWKKHFIETSLNEDLLRQFWYILATYKPSFNNLLRYKKIKELVLNRKGTEIAKDGED